MICTQGLELILEVREGEDSEEEVLEVSFELFISDSIQKIILDCTNLEGRRVFGEGWMEMDQTHLHGVFRSKGEYTESLWDAETGREIFRATMSLENPHNFQDYPL